MDRPLSDAEMGPAGDHPLSDAEMGAAQEGPSALESGVRGLAQGVSFNFADEATGAGEALLDKLRGAHEALGELYLKHRDESRKAYHDAEKANPGVYHTAEFGGAVAPMIAAEVASGGAATPLVAGRLGAIAMGAASGLGASEAETARDLVKDTAISGLVGGAAHLAGGLVAKGLGAVAQKAEPALQGVADTYTLKTGGAIGRDIKKLARQDPELIAKRAQFYRDQGLVTPLSTVQDVADRGAAAVKAQQGAQVGALRGLDEKVAAGGVQPLGMTGNAVADKLEGHLNDVLLQNPNRSPQAEQYLRGRIENYRAMGDTPISFNQMDELTRGAQQNAAGGIGFAVDEAINPGVQQVKKDTAQIMRRHMLEQAGLVDPELAAQRDLSGKMLSQLHPITDLAEARSAELAGQSKLGFTGSHTMLGAAGALLTGHPAVAAAAAVTALGQKVVRQYGNSLTASTFQTLAQVARTAPQKLGKWGPYLAQAAARGDAALATAHYVLSQNDKDYAAQARLALEGGHE